MDFYKIVTAKNRQGKIEVYPDFVTDDVRDIIFRGRAFYAVWDEQSKLWSKKDTRVGQIVDKDIWARYEKLKEDGIEASPKLMSSFKSQSWKDFLNYTRSMSDNCLGHDLDSRIIFSNQETKKSDYASHKLSYPLAQGDCPAWEELMSELYSPEERTKIEWAIGSIVNGDSRKIQKFIVFYGSPGSGKGTVIAIIQKLFDGYCATFNAKALASNSNSFATEMFRGNPLVAIQTDGDLSKIEDNTTLNTIISHEPITINEKFKSSYTSKCNAFLFMASNKPVKITDAKSGLIRRLIDVHPAHDGINPPIEPERYFSLMEKIDFELGAIAWHCKEVYEKLGKNYYSSYRPVDMMYKTDLFFNFVEDSYIIFSENDSTTLKSAYAMYKQYCEDSGADFKLPMYKFREELKNYFEDFADVARTPDGKQVRSYYSHFLKSRFERPDVSSSKKKVKTYSLELASTNSLLDEFLSDCKAQYATKDDIPSTKWVNVQTCLRDLDTTKVHYVKPPENHIVIDFDITDSNGVKSREKNLEAASKWPKTYAEFSKGGNGVHLHYIYDGDVNELSRVYEPGIEVKIFTGNSSLRRRLSFCNDIPVAHISSGLPKKEAKMLNKDIVITEAGIRSMIADCLKKKHHGATKPEVDFIKKILDDAYESGIQYDVRDIRPAVTAFANNSTHRAKECLRTVLQMKWMSEDISNSIEENARINGAVLTETRLIFFDCEVFPNLFVVCWKFDGIGKPVIKMINPKAKDLEELFGEKIIGFNCRRYDNHILYARYIGYSVEELYQLSQRIIAGSKNAMFGEAYNISYTDIYDFSSKKQSLKKWEIEISKLAAQDPERYSYGKGLRHQELGIKWDEPVPKELWEKVVEYCVNDVVATEATWLHLQPDWTAREILAALSGLTVNDTTNSHTTTIIFRGNKRPQSQFNYRNMGDISTIASRYSKNGCDPEYTCFDKNGKPVFPGYLYAQDEKTGKWVSTYRGEEVGEGGYVYAEPGIYRNVALLDIASMHPSSIVAENLFGDEYTARFEDILNARILIKHGDFDRARNILDGKLAPYLDDSGSAKSLSGALKIAINSVYGLTSAKFDNPFRDIRNVDNIVAKRGALFMVNLKHEVQKRGYTVAHIKTDSIKIPDATPEIISFVMEYGKLYGYNFEHEATYDRMCLVNDAVYVARYSDGTWTATGAQFQQPYVFKMLFSKEPLVFDDFCETKSVTTSLYLDFNEYLPEGEHNYIFIGKAGQFTPIKKGCGGGELVREKDGKYYSATGAKGYRWLESELIRGTDKEQDIDRSYYDRMVDDAVRDISEYGDVEAFLA